MIISVTLQHVQIIYSDDDLEWTSHCSCVLPPLQWSSILPSNARRYRKAWSLYTSKVYGSNSCLGIWFCAWCGRWIPQARWNHSSVMCGKFCGSSNRFVRWWVPKETNVGWSSTSTLYWRASWVSRDDRKHRLYALGVEELSHRLKRAIFSWFGKTHNRFRGSCFIWSLDMTGVFWTSMYLKWYQYSWSLIYFWWHNKRSSSESAFSYILKISSFYIYLMFSVCFEQDHMCFPWC